MLALSVHVVVADVPVPGAELVVVVTVLQLAVTVVDGEGKSLMLLPELTVVSVADVLELAVRPEPERITIIMVILRRYLI